MYCILCCLSAAFSDQHAALFQPGKSYAALFTIFYSLFTINIQELIKIDYPPYQPSIKTVDSTEFIFDSFRKKWLVLTPEEWVRQNFISYLVQVLHYPASLIAIEKEIRVGAVTKRFDIVVYNRLTLPFMVVECKEMSVPLNEKVLHQALHYNTNMQAEYVVITNGSYCYGFQRKGAGFVEIEKLPVFV